MTDEERRAYNKQYRENNKEALVEKKKAYREVNSGIINEKQRAKWPERAEKRRQYVQANREKVKAQQKARYESAEHQAHRKEYLKINRDRIVAEHWFRNRGHKKNDIPQDEFEARLDFLDVKRKMQQAKEVKVKKQPIIDWCNPAQRRAYNRAYYAANKQNIRTKANGYEEKYRVQRVEKRKIHRQLNLEKIRAREKAYYYANKEKKLRQRKEYVEANKEEIRLRRKAYLNREEVKAKYKITNKLYVDMHKEQVFALQLKSRLKRQIGKETVPEDVFELALTISKVRRKLNQLKK